MTVYVDSMRAKYGRLVLCHMIADTDEELHAMADRIGVARKWHQSPPLASSSHYDIALCKRALAIEAGAVPITWRQCSLMTMLRRRNPDAPLITPEEAERLLRDRAIPDAVAGTRPDLF
jgi:hypothetical protein